MKKSFRDIVFNFGKNIDILTKRILEGPNADLIDFVNNIVVFLRSKRHLPTSTSNFVANESLSGVYLPSPLGYRLRKLKELAAFAAFYADTVFVQDPFEKILLHGNTNLSRLDRINILFGITSYLYLEPLIEKGIVKYAQSLVNLCDYHKRLLADPLQQKIHEKESLIYKEVSEKMMDSCVISLNNTKRHGTFLEISGPKEFKKHGKINYYYFEKVPPYLKVLAEKEKLPYRLTAEEIKENETQLPFIAPMVDDLFFQEWHSAFYKTKYLTDNELQMRLASVINKEDCAPNSSSLLNGLRHSLPIVFCKDVRETIKIRESEEEVFQDYRDKVNKLLKEARGRKKKQIKEMFNDYILPELNKLNKQIGDRKNSLCNSLSKKISFGDGTVTIGQYSSLLPPDIGKMVSALGDCKCIAESPADFNKISKDEQEARKNELYFLWKAGR